jgi:hypothetical protein
MIENLSIAAVIPAYKVAGHIAKVIETLQEMVNRIIVVDDKCPQQSGQMDPSFIPTLAKPLVSNKADSAKGNRFSEPGLLKGMPRIILGIQFLLQAIQIDINSISKKKKEND